MDFPLLRAHVDEPETAITDMPHHCLDADGKPFSGFLRREERFFR
jgi:hypothetical protein